MPRGRVLCVTLAVAAIAATTAYAAGMFTEPDVSVLHQWEGTQPAANFAWAVSALGDIESKHGADLIVGEPFSANGSAYVYESRDGRLIHRFDGVRRRLARVRDRRRGRRQRRSWERHPGRCSCERLRATSISTPAAPASSCIGSSARRRVTSSAGPSRAQGTSTAMAVPTFSSARPCSTRTCGPVSRTSTPAERTRSSASSRATSTATSLVPERVGRPT